MRIFPQDRRAQIDLIYRELRNINRHRQLRQAERSRFRVRQGILLCRWQPRHVKLICGKAFDLEPSAQERRTVPDQRNALQRQPDALIIGNGHPVKSCFRTQRTAEPVNTNVPPRPAQHILQGACQKTLVILLRHRGQERQAGQGKGQQKAHKIPHQNDCPMPM